MGGIKLRLAQFHSLKYGGRENEAVSISLAAVVLSITFALADAAVTSAAAKKIKAAMEVFGCTGGKMERETEGSCYFEIDVSNAMTGNTTSSSTRTSG